MSSSAIHIALLVALALLTETIALPYRAFSSRSVPGRIRSSSGPDNLDDYLATYLDLVQQQNQQQPIPYGLAEYEPSYQQGYLSRRPQIDSEKLAALLPYISQTEMGSDYTYNDYSSNTPPNAAYTDEEGTWYDDSAAQQEFIPNVDLRDKNNQQAALIQLFLDHLANKYSLEDLETLERQAVLEDNSENQLQSLMPRKKSLLPVLGPHVTARNIIGYPIMKGQKEEPIMVPASSFRKPMFARSPITQQKKDKMLKISSTSSAVTERNAKEEKKIASTASPTQKAPLSKSAGKLTTEESLQISTTMEPAMKSAYDAFKTYLEQERSLRQARDEGFYNPQNRDEGIHTPQKRFVSDTDSLTKQLSSLKKTIT